MFFHFGMNTFTDSEWGNGNESSSQFNPTGLNAHQWVDVASKTGVSLVILTAKHHDWFCLWPSQYTQHSVKNSPWKNGHGDVVRELVDAANTSGIDVGLYLSPWDRHDKRYGLELEYNEYYLAQLQELLNRYGSVKEIWFDGAKGPNATKMNYYFGDWFSMVKELQSSINIFSDAGPDVRWVGDEKGYAGSTCWSTINRTSLRIGDGSIVGYLNVGDPRGTDWVPPECDVSIRTGWFWHKSEEPKPLSQLIDIYYNSVGRNCLLLLNVPPNSTGLISDADVRRLQEFGRAIDTIFTTNLAEGSISEASSQRGGKNGGFGPEKALDKDHLWTYWAPNNEAHKEHWIEIVAREKGFRFNVERIQEAIGLGQRIQSHEIYADGNLVANGTTIGNKRLHRLALGTLQAHRVRLHIRESRGLPLISSIGPYWQPEKVNIKNGTHQ
ncbi:alpha-L-fucosidase 1-like [Macadamia integrifolia]|uniref:alpha-L-fucosidase 1-like n=1 Tax=Macadamia integrifolia TaxID=60698 RepID=UPI001C4F62DA|nr:alpha-L-fucosidase 1-like [Macadamia integrifolia]